MWLEIIYFFIECRAITTLFGTFLKVNKPQNLMRTRCPMRRKKRKRIKKERKVKGKRKNSPLEQLRASIRARHQEKFPNWKICRDKVILSYRSTGPRCRRNLSFSFLSFLLSSIQVGTHGVWKFVSCCDVSGDLMVFSCDNSSSEPKRILLE